jgi:prolipoprotein diacylglyceryltransferase
MEKAGFMKATSKKITRGLPPAKIDIATSALIGFILGYKFVYIFLNSREAFGGDNRPQELLLSADGNWVAGIALAALFGYMRWREAKKEQLPEPLTENVLIHPYEHTGNITMVAAVSGIAGAKLFHLIENPDQFVQFFTNPTVDSFLSGLTVYGGLIVGGISVGYYVKKYCNIPGWRLIDAAAPGLMLAYGIGRIGCQVSGDGDWGIVNQNPKPNWLSWLPDWLWAYDYPNNVNGVGEAITSGPCYDGYCTHLVPAVYPTPVYETAMAVGIFFLLWYLRKRISIPGLIFAIYLIFNGIERFLIESIRVNVKMNFAGMSFTQAQLISVLTFISGIILAFYLFKKHQRQKPA